MTETPEIETKEINDNASLSSLSSLSSNRKFRIIDSSSLRKDIIEQQIYPSIKKEFTDKLEWRLKWQQRGRTYATISFILSVISAILAFASSSSLFENIPYLAFLAGCSSLLSASCDRASHFSNNESKECTKRTNELAKSIGIRDTLPDTSGSNDNSSTISEPIIKKDDVSKKV